MITFLSIHKIIDNGLYKISFMNTFEYNDQIMKFLRQIEKLDILKPEINDAKKYFEYVALLIAQGVATLRETDQELQRSMLIR